ncbi:hypothetical protein SM0020_04620 [Sinorhizobium meliloti CCNWSX0020]|uniref:Uncharacterized protein n=1 Tax=Sinorhizobium meliloti CCNWSX0020 TaxID=1107881 RepID=H0FUT2_RHIML|nr:hypothetical protein SM0020_04620 [Sinorhizobium meliloti CCNWSX0020]
MVERIEKPASSAVKFWSPSLNSITVTLPGGPLGVSAGTVVLPDMAEFGIVDT